MVKVKATTILETVIAMIIILIVFLIAGTIFLNISKTGLTEKKIKATETINIYIEQLKIGELPYESKEELNGFSLITEADDYPGRPGIAMVHCKALDIENRVIVEQKRLMLINNQ